LTDELMVCEADGSLRNHQGEVFDAWEWSWQASSGAPGDLRPITPCAALIHLAASGRWRRVPVGVVGPRSATLAQRETAEALGEALARHGLTVLCGGKSGVMEAVARGCTGNGGLCIGLLPEDDWRGANTFVGVPLATGIGKARNVLIAQASCALIAVGGEYGTLSEVAFGLHFSKPVIGLCGAPEVAGVHHCRSVEEALTVLAQAILTPS
jgi:uncharacterized protein (TIGR00725 family)